ncbi:hypothetical protein EGR_10948 [Echinococcus granulosus]|uniref:Uncharacterized protein n=1 Tax=Echinococcus granulosus TaxID=6210 RepID=W6U741_ECHGR|nr:hypothetical protein EGR_10948 [Echinococcus granulosus]EUB54187.1 hypothetical protein EGR_10948 [Echinococcus granulosus]
MVILTNPSRDGKYLPTNDASTCVLGQSTNLFVAIQIVSPHLIVFSQDAFSSISCSVWPSSSIISVVLSNNVLIYFIKLNNFRCFNFLGNPILYALHIFAFADLTVERDSSVSLPDS